MSWVSPISTFQQFSSQTPIYLFDFNSSKTQMSIPNVAVSPNFISPPPITLVVTLILKSSAQNLDGLASHQIYVFSSPVSVLLQFWSFVHLLFFTLTTAFRQFYAFEKTSLNLLQWSNQPSSSTTSIDETQYKSWIDILHSMLFSGNVYSSWSAFQK